MTVNCQGLTLIHESARATQVDHILLDYLSMFHFPMLLRGRAKDKALERAT
ncbi:hypothetical protein [Bulleidia extructa]